MDRVVGPGAACANETCVPPSPQDTDRAFLLEAVSGNGVAAGRDAQKATRGHELGTQAGEFAVAARASLKALYDPSGDRMRG